MEPYPKIQGLYKRQMYKKPNVFIEGQWTLPEFEYLRDNAWVYTEKINGTNIRVLYDHCPIAGRIVNFRGRTDRAMMYPPLLEKLQALLPLENLRHAFGIQDVCLYGEGYGAKIQKGGGNYIPDGVSFMLFDIKIGGWWLKREDVEGIAKQLDIGVVPVIAEGTIQNAIDLIKNGLTSVFGNFEIEGLVLKPKVELFTRNGNRIITKVKHIDFEEYYHNPYKK